MQPDGDCEPKPVCVWCLGERRVLLRILICFGAQTLAMESCHYSLKRHHFFPYLSQNHQIFNRQYSVFRVIVNPILPRILNGLVMSPSTSFTNHPQQLLSWAIRPAVIGRRPPGPLEYCKLDAGAASRLPFLPLRPVRLPGASIFAGGMGGKILGGVKIRRLSPAEELVRIDAAPVEVQQSLAS